MSKSLANSRTISVRRRSSSQRKRVSKLIFEKYIEKKPPINAVRRSTRFVLFPGLSFKWPDNTHAYEFIAEIVSHVFPRYIYQWVGTYIIRYIRGTSYIYNWKNLTNKRDRTRLPRTRAENESAFDVTRLFGCKPLGLTTRFETFSSCSCVYYYYYLNFLTSDATGLKVENRTSGRLCSRRRALTFQWKLLILVLTAKNSKNSYSHARAFATCTGLVW